MRFKLFGLKVHFLLYQSPLRTIFLDSGEGSTSRYLNLWDICLVAYDWHLLSLFYVGDFGQREQGIWGDLSVKD